jgi:Phage integrase family
VSEATGADIEHLGLERGHRTLVITRKGGKVVTIPLAPRTARAIDLATGERTEGPLFLTADGKRLDRHGAARIVRRVTRRAGIAKRVSPHRLRHAFITAALDAGVPLRTCRKPPPTPIRAPPCATTGHAPAWTGMRPTSSPRSSPEQPDNPSSRICLAAVGGQADRSCRGRRTYTSTTPANRRSGAVWDGWCFTFAPHRTGCSAAAMSLPAQG